MTMAPHLVFFALAALWLAYLIVERVRLDRHRRTVPVRIAVTGTRGKTTVTRRLAAVLSQDGRSVLAKTTGSEAAYLFPDGTVQGIPRLGAPSIIEQKHLIRRGAKMGVEVVLAEVMSLHRENHRVEIQKLLQPHLVVVTNFRVDHMEAQGRTRDEVASVLALDVPPGARAFVSEVEWNDSFDWSVGVSGGEVIRVPSGEARVSGEAPEMERHGEFESNLDLVWAVARHLGVRDDVIREGLRHVQDDVGALRSWQIQGEEAQEPWLLVNAFAANDPESTLRVYDRVAEAQGFGPEACIGLLNLRADRGDRSLQWAEALESGAISRFRRLYLAGLHARAVSHRLRNHSEAGRIELLRPSSPEDTMEQVLGSEVSRGGLLFGFGNIHGLGETLVRHWKKVGKPHGI